MCCLCFCFFFFKQKTAYEMRISDWSSDVCSSDLSLEMSGEKAQLKSGRSRYSLSCLKADEFPALGRVVDGKALQLPRNQLRSLIERTQFAMEIGRASCRARVCQYV